MVGSVNKTVYAFIKDVELTAGKAVVYAENSARVVLDANAEIMLKIPYDAQFIYLYRVDGDNMNRLPSSMEIGNSVLSGMFQGLKLEEISLTSGQYYATDDIGKTITLTPVSNQNWASKIVDCKEGDAFLISGRGGGTVRPFAFVNSNNRIISRAVSAEYYSISRLVIVPENTQKAIIQANANDGYKCYLIKDYNFNELYEKQKTQESGQVVWLPYPLTTYIDNAPSNSNNALRAHSLLFKTVFQTRVKFEGVPAANDMYIYYVDSLNEALSSRKRFKVENGVEYQIPANVYYRYLLMDDGTNPAWEVSGILEKLNEPKSGGGGGSDVDYYDLILFAGQSNMAGRGITNSSHPETYPTILDGAGFEYRAISAPDTLMTIMEPFGYAENKSGGLNDGNSKTGGCVVSFVNAYYKNGGVPVIAVSASEGATDLEEWLDGYSSNTGRLYDAIDRFNKAVAYCEQNNINIRHKFVAWCQGETDAKYIYDGDFTMEQYVENLDFIQQEFIGAGAEKILVIRIGKRASSSGGDTGLTTYDAVIEKQTELSQTDPDLVMICADFAGMRARGLMKDQSHYFQEAYNEVGNYAGINAAIYANTGKEPTMYDTYFDNLYYSKKN